MPRRWLKTLGVAFVAAAVAVTFAAPADAGLSKAQKRKASKVLLKKLKKHPRLIKNKRWLRKASHVDMVLPLTVRLNPMVDGDGPGFPVTPTEAASDDSAVIDLSSTFGPSVGAKTTKLRGVVNVDARFGNPAEGDALGDLRLTVTGANLSASSVGVLEDPGAGAACGDPGAFSAPANTLVKNGTGLATGGAGAPVTAASQAPSVGADTVVRTAPIDLSLATGITTAAPTNAGKANLFAPAGDDVRLRLHTKATINTMFRARDDGTGNSTLGLGAGAIPQANFNCVWAYAAKTVGPAGPSDVGGPDTSNIIPVAVTGELRIKPAITADGRLRIATVNVSSPEPLHSSVNACLQLHSSTTGPGADAVTDGFLTAAGFGATSGVGAAGPNAVQRDNTPNEAADSLCTDAYGPNAGPFTPPFTNEAGFPAAILGVQELAPASAKVLKLDPEVSVTSLSAEALIGTYAQ